MTDAPRECRKIRGLLRRYALGTLGFSATARVEDHIAACERCREALDAERVALAALDQLQPVEPARDLTAAVMDKVRRVEEGEALPRPAFRVPAFVYTYGAIVAVVGILAAVLLPAGPVAREAARRASSANNLKQIGLVLKMYANENNGKFPPLAPYKGVWMLDLERLYPEYLTDPAVLVNPDLPDAGEIVDQLSKLLAETPVDWEEVTVLAARSYTYTNWTVQEDSEVKDLRAGYMQLARADYDNDLEVGDRTFYRLREGIERFFITEINNPAGSAMAQSDIPVMFEAIQEETPRRLFHKPPDYNVLYMDGHVELLEYGERFPATETAADAFRPQ
jgi:prepilin-type processing-associated H-X9-DG protein